MAQERWFAGDQLVEYRAQAPDIGRRCDLLRTGRRLFGSHVARRSGHLVVVGGPTLFQSPGQAEIGNMRRAVLVDENVGWFEVEMQYPETMRVVDRLGDRA